MDIVIIIQLSVLLVLIFLSAYFSASETALTSLSKVELKGLIEKHPKQERFISVWLEDPNKLLTTILIGNNLVNIAASSIATVSRLIFLGPSKAGRAAGIATGLVTFLILVFGEIIPKTYAKQHARTFIVGIIAPLCAFSSMILPVVKVLVAVTNAFIRAFGGQVVKQVPFLTEEEIRSLIDVGEAEGVLEEQEGDMIHSIFEFGDKVVSEVMIPRIDMVAVEEKASFEELLTAAAKSGHSRIPVYRKNIDKVVGMFYVKDLLNYTDADLREKFELKAIVRKPYFVPQTMKISNLLRDFKKERMHMAVVLDEYGGTAGLVTIEDLLEEIVGEITDEYDEEKKMLKYEENDIAVVDGKMELEELNERLGINIKDEEAETVGGFIINLFGRIPRVGEKIEYKKLRFIIEKADDRKIEEIRVIKF